MDETPTRPPEPSPSPVGEGPLPCPPARENSVIPSFETMDRLGRAVTARLTQGISPHAIYDAWFDWASHLANAPGRLIELGLEAVNIGARFARYAAQSFSEDARPPFEPQLHALERRPMHSLGGVVKRDVAQLDPTPAIRVDARGRRMFGDRRLANDVGARIVSMLARERLEVRGHR